MSKAKKREYCYIVSITESKIVTEKEFMSLLKKEAETGQGEWPVWDYLDCKGLDSTTDNVFNALKTKIDTERKVRISNKEFKKIRMRG